MYSRKSELDLYKARAKLFETLGENRNSYVQLLKQWFQMKHSREEFYLESRKLLSGDQIKLHNTFLLSLFNVCQFPTIPLSKPFIVKKTCDKDKGKRKDNENERVESERLKSRKISISDRKQFLYANPSDYSSTLCPIPIQTSAEPAQTCHQEVFLPDKAHIRGRLFLSAWENGIDGASEQAAECLVEAVNFFLKNILSSVFSQRSGYKVREERFQHSLGAPIPDPMLRNSSRHISSGNFDLELAENEKEAYDIGANKAQKSIDDINQQVIFEIAMSKPPSTAKPPVSAFELLETLQTERKNIPIPSHIVFSVNIARIIARLHHATQEEQESGRKMHGSKVIQH